MNLMSFEFIFIYCTENYKIRISKFFIVKSISYKRLLASVFHRNGTAMSDISSCGLQIR